ncbi:MAG: Methyltransferase type 11 [Mucilaginibacter sp.]|nr:Methyltransferase type 11 [Mucilaginibacter sp.]MDB5138711.1 Methyltransferase type 11 [Mucilaginibacter sp.]
MGALRKPFDGVKNIVCFNWHFYLFSIGLILLLFLLDHFLKEFNIAINCLIILITTSTASSIIVSFYIYDLSGLYKFYWLNDLYVASNSKIVCINAGFDETSILLNQKFAGTSMIVCDFYDPLKHTEISIKRARKVYIPSNTSLKISTSVLPFQDSYADNIFLIFSAHEIRKDSERNKFFSELKRVLKSEGKIILTEHLRDVPNFLAFNIGFFHFFTKLTWYKTFKMAGLTVVNERKFTPFVTNFTLVKNGSES